MRTLALALLLSFNVAATATAASLGTAAPQPVMIEPVAPVEADSAARKAAADSLARILYPEGQQIAAAERMVDKDMGAAFRSDADFLALEKEFPGLIEAVLNEVKPALARFTRNRLPEYHQRVAALLASHFSTPELEDIAKFYLTPTGQKIVRGMHENATGGAMLGEIMADPDKPTSLSAVASDHKTASQATKKLIDTSDEPALTELTKKPYFLRMATLGPKMRKLDLEFTNEPDPEFEAEVAAIFEAVIARFESRGERVPAAK